MPRQNQPRQNQECRVTMFSDILSLNDKIGLSFPELQSLAERCVILIGAALGDDDGGLNVTVWAERSRLTPATLRRFIREFARLGLVEADHDIGLDRVRISSETYHRLSRY